MGQLTMAVRGSIPGRLPPFLTAGVTMITDAFWRVVAIEPAARSADAVGRLWIVDGTLIPVRDRKAGASSRNYRFSANV